MIGQEDIESVLVRTEPDFGEVEDGIRVVRPGPGEESGDLEGLDDLKLE